MAKRFLVPISTDHIDLNLNNTFANSTGRLRWDSEEGTLDLGMNNSVVQSVGMEFYMPPTKNNSGVEIPAGSFVMATGAQGDRITIAKAITNGTISPEYMIGVAAHTIVIGSETGLITTNGTVKDINTNLWPVGTILYPNPSVAGGLTSTKPPAPNIKTPIAIVLRQHEETGRIYVRMSSGSVLGGTDSNVEISSPQNGDILSYNSSTQIWENGQLQIVVPETASYTASTDKSLFFNTTTGKMAIYDEDTWKEFAYEATFTNLNGGSATTASFENTIDGGNASTEIFVNQYDGGSSYS